MTADAHSFPLQPDRAQFREALTYLFLASLTLLSFVGVVIAYQFSLPKPEWSRLGHVDDFPVAEPVLTGIGGIHVWVVNTGESFVALHAIPNDSTRCHILWDANWQLLVDPCRGSGYTLTGIFTTKGPPPDRSLDRFPLRVDDQGDLYMESTTPILGLTYEQVKQACKAQVYPASYRDQFWQQYCDFNAIGLEQVDEP